ncbi:D-alanyl-D-alanine carboxypeptidase family protein [Demequina gelatinilytica]|uniref:D-alanyl-D-alanine carboxypeptidase family protein n=1 Tax=Demequina gelatinilytica TaxID=1638980 RepID=UPI000781875E|nr:D-alanyl-D-alanine carboxypeptidase family protein [Demequina gelatinilytica]
MEPARPEGLARRVTLGLGTAALGLALATTTGAPASAADASPGPSPTQESAGAATGVEDTAAEETAEETAAPEPTTEPEQTAAPEPEPAATPKPTSQPTATGAPAPSPDAEPSPDASPQASPEPRASTAPDPAPTPDPAPAETPTAPSGTAPSVAASEPSLTPYDPTADVLMATGPAPLKPTRFSDVSGTLGAADYSAFAADIAWLGREGIATGAPDDAGEVAFDPDATLTRGEFAAYLYRLAGSPADGVPAVSVFTDAQAQDTEHAAEIAWVAAQGIASGSTEDGTREFHPDEPLTRGAAARMLHRFAGLPKGGHADPYVDVEAGTRLDDAAAWLASRVAAVGWDGAEGREFRADEPLTKGAVAAMLHRAVEAGVTFSGPGDGTRLVTPVTVVVDGADTLNLRAGPSLEAQVVSWASQDDELETTGAVTGDGWVQVLDDGDPLWASLDYLARDTSVAPDLATTGTTAATLSEVYANGEIPASALCALPWKGAVLLECGAAADLGRLDDAFHERFGIHVPVGSGYRDLAGQYAARASKGRLAATPGTSNHGWGEAIDLDESGLPGGYGGAAYAWLVSQAPAYGWHLPAWAGPGGAKPEPWHLEHLESAAEHGDDA